MILCLTPMLPSIPLEKRGFLRPMGFMEGTGQMVRSGVARANEPLLSMNAGQTQNLSTRYSLRPRFNIQLDEDVLYVRLHRFRSDC
jgi:hypothetical protein